MQLNNVESTLTYTFALKLEINIRSTNTRVRSRKESTDRYLGACRAVDTRIEDKLSFCTPELV